MTKPEGQLHPVRALLPAVALDYRWGVQRYGRFLDRARSLPCK